MNLECLNLNQFPAISGDKYLYKGRAVPRVTEILSDMLHEDYLMEWSNNIGLYKHRKYKEVIDEAADIGSYVHSAIENYLKKGIDLDPESIPQNIRQRVIIAFNSFLQWWNIISRLDYEILMQEKELICKYFGGTLDLLIRINGKVYLVDFKTSNYPNYKHFLQLSAYRYMLKETKNIQIDGCIILMLNKYKQSYFEEYTLDFSINDHMQFIDNCEETFKALVFAFYQRLRIQQQYLAVFNLER